MKILIVDNNEPASRFISAQLDDGINEIIVEHDKSRVSGLANDNVIHAVFLDPAPQKDPQKIITNLQASLKNRAYVAIVSETLTYEDAVHGGANDMLRKPLETEAIIDIANNAARFCAFEEKLHILDEALAGDDGEIIGRAAFAQVFRSALERAKRYNTKPYMLLVKVGNYERIMKDFGEDAAAASIERLCSTLLKQYRLSEVIAHTDPHEYAIFLENVEVRDRAIAAAERFGKTLFRDKAGLNDGQVESAIGIELVELPTARVQASYQL